MTRTLILAIILAVVPNPQTDPSLRLTQRSVGAVPDARKVNGIVVTGAGVALAAGTRWVRLYDDYGVVSKRLTFAGLSDSFVPGPLAGPLAGPYRARTVLFDAYGNGCAYLDWTQVRADPVCSVPLPFRRVRSAFVVRDRLVIVGRSPENTKAIHVFSGDLRRYLGSFHEVRPIRAVRDSAVLEWGVGLAGATPTGTIVYSEGNPFSLREYDLSGRAVEEWSGESVFPSAESHADSAWARPGMPVLGRFSRVTGLVALPDCLLLSVYNPAEATTDLLSVDLVSDRVLARTTFPYGLDLLVADSTDVMALRVINRSELVRYEVIR